MGRNTTQWILKATKEITRHNLDMAKKRKP